MHWNLVLAYRNHLSDLNDYSDVQSTIFLFLFLNKVSSITSITGVLYDEILFKNKNKKIVLCTICLKKSFFIPRI